MTSMPVNVIKLSYDSKKKRRKKIEEEEDKNEFFK